MEPLKTYSLEQLKKMSLEQLQNIAEKLKIENFASFEEQALMYKIIDQQAVQASLLKTKRPPTKKAKSSTTTPKTITKKPNKGKVVSSDTEASQKVGTPHSAKKEGAKSELPEEKKSKEEPKKSTYSLLELSIPNTTFPGVLEVMPDHYGFLRFAHYNYLSSPDDTYVSHTIIRQLGLKTGDTIEGVLRPPREGEKYFGLLQIDKVNGRTVEEVQRRVDFKYHTALFPQEKFNIIAPGQKPFGARLFDLLAPIGKGQRGLIVAQPKTGKTSLLKDIANGIAYNHPQVHLMIVLIGERPEEVTDMQRNVNAEVVSSTFMQPEDEQIKVATMAIEKAKRLAECGHDVVIMLDSITRLARAFNAKPGSSGKVGTGGVEYQALKKTQQLFGTANNLEKAGSVTILATALVETGSKMDDIIFEELKGTGNLEVQLRRDLANRGIYPAIDITSSSTRRHELMQGEDIARRLDVLRRIIADMNPQEAINFLKKNMKDKTTNEDFLAAMYQPS